MHLENTFLNIYFSEIIDDCFVIFFYFIVSGNAAETTRRIPNSNSPLSQPPTPPKTPLSPGKSTEASNNHPILHNESSNSETAQSRLTSPLHHLVNATSSLIERSARTDLLNSDPTTTEYLKDRNKSSRSNSNTKPSFQSEFEKVHIQKLFPSRTASSQSLPDYSNSIFTQCSSPSVAQPQNLTVTKPSNCGQNSVKIKTVNSVNNNVSCYSTENSNSNIDMDQIRQKMADLVALPNKTPRVSFYL